MLVALFYESNRSIAIKLNLIPVEGVPKLKMITAQQFPASQEAASMAPPTDTQTLSMLYRGFQRPIHFYVYHLLGNQEDADDVTQEVFVRACIAWEDLHDRHNLSAWLYRVAK
ncbi:MAG: sigma-70 family RNA polymerase sigma factor, partial [Chloroflexota bacterium]|nr:sigma-70 family RNA polymerase sigma factor [Chloroflexota bacterium]